jgi:hypothetical protein
MPLNEEISYYEWLKEKPFVTGIDIQGLIYSYAENNSLLKMRLQDNTPILESLRPTFQRALEELPKNYWNWRTTGFFDSENYQQTIKDLANLVYIRQGGRFRLDTPSDYGLFFANKRDIKNIFMRGIFNLAWLPLTLVISPLILTVHFPTVYFERREARLTFEENPQSFIIKQIKSLEGKIEQYT